MELFGTAGIRGSVEDRVTPELALAVGRAAGHHAQDAGRTVVVLGRDGRDTGPALAAAVKAGLLSAGVDVRLAGVVPTPAVAFASRSSDGVMLTASHNPPGDNGLKLFRDGVEFDRSAERRIEHLVASPPPAASWSSWGRPTTQAVLGQYRTAVGEYARLWGADLADLPVAVDCGNGMASLVTPQVLRALGADVVALNANVDGRFPGRASKPTLKSLADLRAFIADGPFALGIGHDGDADRVVFIDADGAVVHEDTVVAILAEHYTVTADGDDPVVVTTPNASARIDDRVDAAGGRVTRTRLGALHEGIATAEESGGNVVFAAEPWKHIHPAFGGWIDGVVSAAVLSRLVAADGLPGLREPVPERPYRKENVPCPDDRKAAAMDRVTDNLVEVFPTAAIDTEYGVRLDFDDGSWILVRPSGTEPYLRIYVESHRVDDLIETARSVVTAAVEE